MESKKLSKSTLCVHKGTYLDKNTGGVNTPVFTSTAIGYRNRPEPVYPRYFNIPNQGSIQQKLAALEHGEDALIFSSGMAAVSAVFYTFLQQGDHVIFQGELYGGTIHFIEKEFPKFGIEYSFTKGSGSEDFQQHMRPETRMVYIESPTNPLLTITPMKAIADLAKEKRLLTVIDNTFASPIIQNPIDAGIDIVLHSGTKYLGGHSDLTSGAVIGTKHTIGKIMITARNLGGNLNAEDCYLLERSLKTMAIRVQRQSENALEIAKFLEQHELVDKVYYPGLKTHPGYELAKKQMKTFGGMLSFEPAPNKVNIEKMLDKLKIIMPAISLGGVDSTICSPAKTSHGRISAEERKKMGVKDNLLRLSVGIEGIDDLKNDLAQALEA